MTIFVKIPAGQSIAIHPRSSDTIEQVKYQIENECGISVIDQRLVFGGKELEDDETLGGHAISNCATVYMVGRLGERVNLTPTKPLVREVVLPSEYIDFEVIKEYLRSHVDSGAKTRRDCEEQNVDGVITVIASDVLGPQEIREILIKSGRATEKETEALVEEYRGQLEQRLTRLSPQQGDGQNLPCPWISLLRHAEVENTEQETPRNSLELEPADPESEPPEYSDGELRKHWRWNKTAVDVLVRVNQNSQAHAKIARIDSISDGCFISKKLFNTLQPPLDPERSKIFQCPSGGIRTVGSVKLLLQWKNEHGKNKHGFVKFNVPNIWKLDSIDMLVTVQMAVEMGIDKVARPIEPSNLLAANERICSGVSWRRQSKKQKEEASKANELRAEQNRLDEAMWRENQRRLRQTNQPEVTNQSEATSQAPNTLVEKDPKDGNS